MPAGFLTHLARDKGVGAATQNQAFNALLFFYRRVLEIEYAPEGVTRARRTKYVPQTLTREEIDAVISGIPAPYSLLAGLLYGCGLRLTEALTLRVHSFDFDLGVLTVHRGKGQKDRTVPLPAVLREDLSAQMRKVREVYESDLGAGYCGAFMPKGSESAAWNRRATKWEWQFFFPATELTRLTGNGDLRRYHLHPNRFGDLLRQSAKRLGTHKKISAHTFRHSFASHLLLANFDIKTIQEMLGHSDVRTTMIYVQTVPSRTKKQRVSPLDFPPGHVAGGNR
jgi:integron integrase